MASCTLGNNNVTSQTKTKNSLIDYKKYAYNLYVGQAKDSIDKVLELKHDYLKDDGNIDTNGVTHYLNISEDLINIGGIDCLPALFFTINKQILTEFKCSILLSTSNKIQTDSLVKLLDCLKPLFTTLDLLENRTTLARTLKLEIETEEFKESFYLNIKRKYNLEISYEKKKKF